MALRSKAALVAALALVAVAALAGGALAASSSPSPSAGQNGVSPYGGDWRGQDGLGPGSGPHQGLGQMGGEWRALQDVRYGDRGWDANEVLQWVAIAVLGGLAAAALIWRPWRRGPAAPAAVTQPPGGPGTVSYSEPPAAPPADPAAGTRSPETDTAELPTQSPPAPGEQPAS